MIQTKATITIYFNQLLALKSFIPQCYQERINLSRSAELEICRFYNVKDFFHKKLLPRLEKGDPKKPIDMKIEIIHLVSLYGLLRERSFANPQLFNVLGILDHAYKNLPIISRQEEHYG